jgi:hypothetical protein
MSSASLHSTRLGVTHSRFSLPSVSAPSEDEEDDSESDFPLDMEGAFDVSFTARVCRRVTGSPHPSGSPADCNLKPLDYSRLALAD